MYIYTCKYIYKNIIGSKIGIEEKYNVKSLHTKNTVWSNFGVYVVNILCSDIKHGNSFAVMDNLTMFYESSE